MPCLCIVSPIGGVSILEKPILSIPWIQQTNLDHKKMVFDTFGPYPLGRP